MIAEKLEALEICPAYEVECQEATCRVHEARHLGASVRSLEAAGSILRCVIEGGAVPRHVVENAMSVFARYDPALVADSSPVCEICRAKATAEGKLGYACAGPSSHDVPTPAADQYRTAMRALVDDLPATCAGCGRPFDLVCDYCDDPDDSPSTVQPTEDGSKPR